MRVVAVLSRRRHLIVSIAMKCTVGSFLPASAPMPGAVPLARSRDHAMKPVTVDMLRAHLLVASFTALCAEVLALLALLLLPVSQQLFSSTPFRLLALAAIVSGVIVTREFAQAAFEHAVRERRAIEYEVGGACTAFAGRSAPAPSTLCVAIAEDCPQRWLVELHLQLTGRPFVLVGF